MMQPTEDRLSPDFTPLRQSMPIHRSRPGQGLVLINMINMRIRWQPGLSAHVRAAFVVMANPLFQHYSQMTLTEGKSGSPDTRVGSFPPTVRSRRWRESSTTPQRNLEGQRFRIIHPHHPWCGREFELLTRKQTWGEDRALFGIHRISSPPASAETIIRVRPYENDPVLAFR